jgi:hypothetical protein
MFLLKQKAPTSAYALIEALLFSCPIDVPLVFLHALSSQAVIKL